MSNLDLKPIESAPKDGTKIFLVSEHKEIKIGYWGGTRPPCWKDDSGSTLLDNQIFWDSVPDELNLPDYKD